MTDQPSPTQPTDAEFDEAKQHFATVGVIASCWAAFEYSIDYNTLELGDLLSAAALCLTAQVIGSARKLDAYIAVARMRKADGFIKELNKFATATTSLAERRNRVIHDPWKTLGGAPTRTEVTARRILKVQMVSVAPQELQDLLDTIQQHTAFFTVLHAKIMAAIGTSK